MSDLLGETLATLRRDWGLTREQVAAVAPFSARFLTYVEEGRIKPNQDGIKQISTALIAARNAKDPGVAASTVPGSNLTSHQQSN